MGLHIHSCDYIFTLNCFRITIVMLPPPRVFFNLDNVNPSVSICGSLLVYGKGLNQKIQSTIDRSRFSTPNLRRLQSNVFKCPPRGPYVSQQKLSPHCLETTFDSQLPSPKLSPTIPPEKLSRPHKRGHFSLFQNYPRSEGNCETFERHKLSRGNFCLETSRCLFWPTAGQFRNLNRAFFCDCETTIIREK